MQIDGSISTNYADTRAIATSGAKRAEREFAEVAQAVAAGDVSVGRMAEATEAQTLYAVNMKMLKMTDEMVGQVLNLLA